MEIFNGKNNAPKVKITDAKFSNVKVYLSMSHSNDKAVAFAAAMEIAK